MHRPESEEQFSLQNIADKLTTHEWDAFDAAQAAVKAGFLLIGTARLDVIVHEPPRPDIARLFNVNTGEWEYFDDTPELRATNVPEIAIACALFGDPNERGQRKKLSGANGELTKQPPPHFGWTRDGKHIHAIADLITGVYARGPLLQGSVDIVANNQSFRPIITEAGVFSSSQSHKTLLQIPVTGMDMPANVVLVDYDRPEETPNAI